MSRVAVLLLMVLPTLFAGADAKFFSYIGKAPDRGSCFQPPATSSSDHPCKPPVRRFTFRGGQCEEIQYDRCGASTNLFRTSRQCRVTCGVTARLRRSADEATAVRSAACGQEVEIGTCKAAKPRYAFNVASGECRRFSYGGCGGNGNNFRTLGECREACVAA